MTHFKLSQKYFWALQSVEVFCRSFKMIKNVQIFDEASEYIYLNWQSGGLQFIKPYRNIINRLYTMNSFKQHIQIIFKHYFEKQCSCQSGQNERWNMKHTHLIGRLYFDSCFLYVLISLQTTSGHYLAQTAQKHLQNVWVQASTGRSSALCGLRASVPPVVPVRLLEHVLAGYLSFEFGADEEGAAHLAVEGVRLLWRRREALPQHHRDELVDTLGGALSSKVKGLLRGEGLPEDHHCVHVGVLHRLITAHSRQSTS